MAELWQLVQGLRGQTLQTPTGRGTFTVLDVDEHGLRIDVQGGGTYRLVRDAIEAAATLIQQDLSAAHIRRLGISDSQPSYIAAVVRAVRKQSLDATEMPDRTTASKYDTFWNSRISELRQCVDRASRGESAELDATAITPFGNRVSWSGSADINQVTVLSASMAHMVSLARVVAMSQICVPYPATAFHFAMSSTGRLRITVARPPDQHQASLATATEDCHPLVGGGLTSLNAPVTIPTTTEEYEDVRLAPTDACARIHRILSGLPVYRGPREVPFADGLYFFYERRERTPHMDRARIVRIGNHPRSDHRLVGRLREHYSTRPDAKNGSVFRLLVGGALIRRDDPNSTCLAPGPGLGHWERHMALECDRCAPYEERVTEFLNTECAFRCIAIPDRAERNRFEALLVATVAACAACRPSETWLGCHAWHSTVKRAGLWNREFVGGPTMSQGELRRLEQQVATTPGAAPRDGADLTSTLLLIPCSAGKAGATDPQLTVVCLRDRLSPAMADLLEEGRHLAFQRTSIDLHSGLRPAIATYTGMPYATPGFRDALVSQLRRGLHCLIISGGYGLVLPQEPIHTYEAHLQHTRGIWSKRIPALLRDYVQRNGIRQSFAVFSGSYATVVPADLTGCDWRAVEAFDAGDEGSPLRVVPQKVGATLMRLMQSDYDAR